MSRILIISFSHIATDPRVMRQVNALKLHHSIHVAGFGAAPDGVRQFLQLSTARSSKLIGLLGKAMNVLCLLMHCFSLYYWKFSAVQNALLLTEDLGRFDLVVANDLMALPLALQIARGAPVLLDAHEYAPREFDDIWHWRLLFAPLMRWICRVYLPKIRGMSTVCEGIAREYASQYSVQPIVVPNCPARADLLPQPVDANAIKLVHHGAAIRSRHIERMLATMQHLDDRYSLTLMLVENDPAYMRELQEIAKRDPRIRFISTVPMRGIARVINAYDIGVFLLPPVNFNYLHALPNKFFEFMQARLAIAIGPSPEMNAYLDKWGCGVVSSTFEPAAFAQAILSLSAEDIWRMKLQSAEAAAVLNAGHCEALIRDQVNLLLQAPRL